MCALIIFLCLGFGAIALAVYDIRRCKEPDAFDVVLLLLGFSVIFGSVILYLTS